MSGSIVISPEDLASSLPLSALGSVPWGSLRHAYGPARDVPALIRDLAGSPARRERAERALYGNVFHQGTRYEAAAYAVPFVVGLLDRPELRRTLLEMLLAFAVGYEESWFPKGFDLAAEREWQASLDSSENRFGVDAVNTHLAVSRAWPHIAACLDDPNPAAGQGAAHVLAYLPEHATASLDLLGRRLPTERGEVHASCALAMAVLARQHQQTIEVGVGDETREGRIGVWCARAILGDQTAADVLLDGLGELGEFDPIGDWLDGSTKLLIVESLSILDGWLTTDRLDRVGQALIGAPWFVQHRIASPLLRATFTSPPPESAASLTPLQRQCLEVLAAVESSSASGSVSVNWIEVLRAWMVPASGPALADYLAGAPLSDCLDPRRRDAT